MHALSLRLFDYFAGGQYLAVVYQPYKIKARGVLRQVDWHGL
jgi:hypothetical protein